MRALPLHHERFALNWISMLPLVLDYLAATEPLHVYEDEASGALHCQGDSLAEGIMLYGGLRQLITPEAVRDAAERWDGRTVITLGHPSEDVGPENVARYQVGDVGNTSLVIGKGGYTACRVDMALRRQDAIDLARRGRLTGLSRGHTPIIDRTPGVHPHFGAYDERRIGHTGTNHIALCGDTDALPPPRGGDSCGIYLDAATPPQGQPMTRKKAREILRDAANAAMLKRVRDAFNALAVANDAVSIDKAIPLIKELMADPIGLMVLRAIVAEGAEPAEAPEMAPGMTEAAMDARISAALKPLMDAVAALKAEEVAEAKPAPMADGDMAKKLDAATKRADAAEKALRDRDLRDQAKRLDAALTAQRIERPAGFDPAAPTAEGLVAANDALIAGSIRRDRYAPDQRPDGATATNYAPRAEV